MKRPILLLPLLVAQLGLLPAASAAIKLSKVFTPHMVLQRGIAAPIWGTAVPGENVIVHFRDQTKTAEAGADGKWSVKLDPLQPGGPDVLTVNDQKIDDVLVGDVWVGSGQSNMDMPVGSYTANDPVLAQAAEGTYPKIRLMRKEGNAVWMEATPANIKGFSAMLFSFGLPLQKEIDVPVGLMVGAVGGTPSGYWLTEDMFQADAACQEQVKKYAATFNYDQAKTKYDADVVKWKADVEAAKAAGKPAPRGPQPVVHPGEATGGKMGFLYQSFVLPYVGYGIKGVLWDQGESGTAVQGVDQYALMGALIKGWRHVWGQGDFPFLYVQKPSGGGPAWDFDKPMTNQANKFAPQPKDPPQAANAGAYNALHIKIKEYPQTYMVTSTDLGPNTHPVNKSGYGARGAQVALGAVYGKPGEIYGPTYTSHRVDGDKVILTFDHVGPALAAAHSKDLQGFAIAGADKKFVWGHAVIQGNTVVVSSPTISNPVAVRYAWSGNFPWANLFSTDGLPALPFRTDEW